MTCGLLTTVNQLKITHSGNVGPTTNHHPRDAFLFPPFVSNGYHK